MQVAGFAAEFERVLAHYFRKAIRSSVGVIRLERDQRGCTDSKVVEIDLWHILRISGIAIGVNPQGACTGNEPERRKRCLATLGVIQVGSCAEESQPCFINGGGSEGLGITYDELLSTGWSLRRKSRHTRAATG